MENLIYSIGGTIVINAIILTGCYLWFGRDPVRPGRKIHRHGAGEKEAWKTPQRCEQCGITQFSSEQPAHRVFTSCALVYHTFRAEQLWCIACIDAFYRDSERSRYTVSEVAVQRGGGTHGL